MSGSPHATTTDAPSLAVLSAGAVPSAQGRRGPAGLVRRHPALLVFAVALLVRLAAAVAIRIQFDGAIFADDLTYPQLAEARANGSHLNWDSYSEFLYRATATLTVPLTLLYRLFGPEMLVGQAFVAVFGALTAGATTRLLALRLPVGYAVFGGLCVALLPSQVLWSSLTLKDPLVWAALSGLALVLSLAGRTDRRRALLVLLAATAGLLVALVGLRPHTLVIACWGLLLAGWFVGRAGRLRRMAGIVLLVTVIPWSLAGIGPVGVSLVLSPGSLEERRANNAADASTAFVPDATGMTPEQIAARVQAEERAAALRSALEAAQQEAAAARSPADAAAALARARAAQAALQEAEARRSAEAEARPRQTFGEGIATSSNLHQLPTGVAVMLIAPKLWEPSDNRSVELARYEMVVWYPLLLLAAVGLTALRRHGAVLLFPLLTTGAIVLSYALSEGNFGTAYRHRGEFVWAVCLFAAFGAERLARAFGKHREQARH